VPFGHSPVARRRVSRPYLLSFGCSLEARFSGVGFWASQFTASSFSWRGALFLRFNCATRSRVSVSQGSASDTPRPRGHQKRINHLSVHEIPVDTLIAFKRVTDPVCNASRRDETRKSVPIRATNALFLALVVHPPREGTQLTPPCPRSTRYCSAGARKRVASGVRDASMRAPYRSNKPPLPREATFRKLCRNR